MSSELSIVARGVSKVYRIYNNPEDRLKQSIIPRIQQLLGRPRSHYFTEFPALSEINFEIKKGETVGIVGKNGSGKSTLLQIICGTMTPTTGEVLTNGRIAALLELGSGFNPEFTGRENIYLNGAILGLTKEQIEGYFDQIVSFADIGEFLDRPVKTYSSGMSVRLAFAVQAQIEPDILIVDEALAVGDAKFQIKCFNHLKKLKDNGTSILLVTHSTEQIVSHCNRAILLDSGRIRTFGEPRSVVNQYLDLLFGRERSAIDDKSLAPDLGIGTGSAGPGAHGSLSLDEARFVQRPNYNPHEHRWGDRYAEILDFCLFNDQEEYPVAVSTGTVLHLWFSARFNQEVVRPIYGITIKTKEGVTVYGKNTIHELDDATMNAGRARSLSIVKTQFAAALAPGDYFISIGIASRMGDSIIPHDRRYDSIHFHISPTDEFHGIADLKVQIQSDNLNHA